jgi:hypothetical protein
VTHHIGEGTRLGMDALLQELVLDSADVADFIAGLAAPGSGMLLPVARGVLGPHPHPPENPSSLPTAIPGSGPWVAANPGTGDGPCLTALRGPAAVLVPDLPAGHRWPGPFGAATRQGRQWLPSGGENSTPGLGPVDPQFVEEGGHRVMFFTVQKR